MVSSVLFVCFFFGVFDLYIMFLRKEDEICELSGFHSPQVGYSKTRIGARMAKETGAVC